MADAVRAQRVETGRRAVAERGIGDRRMLLAGISQLVPQPVIDNRQAAVETVGVVLGGQTPRRGEIGHFQIGSLSSSRTISSGMGLVQGPYERIPRLVIQMEDMRLPDVPVGGDEQVGQRPLRGAESPELGRPVEAFLL